jgi:DNA-binding NarL/FixJ family response regulator
LVDTEEVSLASVLILDDDQFSLITLKQALIGLNISVVIATESIPKAIETIKNVDTQVAILDLDLGPGPNGVDVANMMRKINPNIGVILLTSFSDPRLANPYGPKLPQGSIFFTKAKLRDFNILVNAILLARKYPLVSRKQENPELNLSDRQIEVLKALATGLSTIEIAKSLDLSEKTIEAIISKLHSSLELQRDKRFNVRIQLARAYFALSGRTPPNG